MTQKINNQPFELMGFTYEEYLEYCNKFNKKINKESKKEFFDDVYSGKVIKINGKIEYR